MPTEISLATAADEADFGRLWTAYLQFYKTHLPDGVSRATWRRALDPSHPFRLLIARDAAGMARGFALHHLHPSSWGAVGDMYLEDLYVAAEARGAGLGRALVEAVIDAARETGAERVYWMTDADNATARALYDRIAGGADGHVRYRMTL